MATAKLDPETSLQIRRMFTAPREKVFRAWTERAGLEKWMCRDVPTHDPKYLELDVRPGGRYVIEIKMPEGFVYRGQGVFREVKPPEKLVFTWAWTRSPENKSEPEQTKDSLVTVELFQRGTFSEMVFTHEQFESAKIRDDHKKGWDGCFDVLAKALEA
jgi:uncharacterized protein YndB with AHSA1/START domain